LGYVWAAVLGDANLSAANLTGADLTRTILLGTVLDEATQMEARPRLIWEILTRGSAGRDLSGSTECS
jgi:uncharacterized protein YjbI with pentapeptide repeats